MQENLNYILGLPEFILGIGNVYPVKIKNYAEFNKCSSPLFINKQHFVSGEEYALLDLLMCLQEEREFIIANLVSLFSLVLGAEVTFYMDDLKYEFRVANGDEDNPINLINISNYEQLRSTIMLQNLMFQQKVYKDKLVQEWAERTIVAKSKNGIKITTEDMLSTVSVYKGVSYAELADYTIYQLQADFKRITKIKEFDSTVEFKCAGSEAVLKHYAEWIDMFSNPYADLFVSKDKVDNMNKIFN